MSFFLINKVRQNTFFSGDDTLKNNTNRETYGDDIVIKATTKWN